MRFWHKLVSGGVLAVVLLLPLVPMLAMCAPQSSDSMQCPGHCPMMAATDSNRPAIEFQADQSGSCCTIKSSTPAPKQESTVVPVISVEPTAVSFEPVVVAAAHNEIITDSSPPPFLDAQAHLCTFLI